MDLRFRLITCVLLLSLGMGSAAPQSRDDDTGDWWWKNYAKPTPKPSYNVNPTPNPFDYENPTPKPRHHGFIVNDVTTKSYRYLNDDNISDWLRKYNERLGKNADWTNFNRDDSKTTTTTEPMPVFNDDLLNSDLQDQADLLKSDLSNLETYTYSWDTGDTVYEDSGLHGGYIAAIVFGSIFSVIICALRVWCWSKRIQRACTPTTAVITRTTRIRVLSVAELPKGPNSDTAQLITPPPYEEERSPPPAYEAGVNPAPHGEGSEPPPYEQGNTASRDMQRL